MQESVNKLLSAARDIYQMGICGQIALYTSIACGVLCCVFDGYLL